MNVICHSCARIWEVLDPEEWGDPNQRAHCAYCGRAHTAEMCRESQAPAPLAALWQDEEDEEAPKL